MAAKNTHIDEITGLLPETCSQHNNRSKKMESRYTVVNFIAFTASCFFNVAFVVFLTGTQSFFLTDVLGITDKIGNYIGTLGAADEVIVILLGPMMGALSDKIGTNLITFIGVLFVGISLIIYTLVSNVYPELLLVRMVFAFGATCSMSMMTALLAELSNSGFDLSSLMFWKRTSSNAQEPEQEPESEPEELEPEELEPELETKKNGKLTSVIGIASGCGALFSATTLMRLPVKFGLIEPPAQALKHSYLVVGSAAIFVAFLLLYGLYSKTELSIHRFLPKAITKYLDPYEEILDELNEQELELLDQHEHNENNLPYLELIKLGFKEIKDEKILFAYSGSVLSRANTVLTTSFIPLIVKQYAERGSSEQDPIVRAAILTGIIHLFTLIFAPICGILIDKHGSKKTLAYNCIIGFVACGGFAFLNPNSSIIYLNCVLFGISSIGSILSSLSLCTDENRNHNGSISGVYSLFGAVGILLLSKIGGKLSDYWLGSPFLIIMIYNLFLFCLIMILSHRKKTPVVLQ